MKKINTIIIINVLLILIFTIPSHALNFIDTPDGAWYNSFVQHAYDKGWIEGYGNGMFGPDDHLTYAQAVTIIVRSTGLQPTNANDKWYSGFVETAKNAGYIGGDYDWDAPIPRLEMAKIIIKAYDIEPTVLNKHEEGHGKTSTSPFIDINDDYITSLYNYKIIAGIITENGLTFQPEKTLTRAEICTMLTRLDTHPVLSEKIKNKDFSSNDYTSGYQYFLDRKYSYDPDSSETKNIVDGILYMVTNDLYEVEFKYYESKDLIKDKTNQMFDIWKSLSYTYPEYFSIYHNCGAIASYENGHYTITFVAYPMDIWTKQEAIAERTRLFKYAKDSINELVLSNKINPYMTETEKAYVIASWIVDNAQYDITYSKDSHYGSDFYDDKTMVCEGYTTLYNTMLKFLDINVYGVMGTANGGNHMWSLNNLDGNWSYTDVTHMDPIDFDNPEKPYFNDKYFNKSEEELINLNNTRVTNYTHLNNISILEIESWKN